MGGDGGVGKTTMLHKYIYGIFMESMNMTIGLDFFVKKLSYDSSYCTLQIWDLGGQERFGFLHDRYVDGAHMGVLLFDLTRRYTLESIPYWVQMLRSLDDKLPLIIIGTKYDLIEENDYLEIEEAHVFEIAKMCNIKKEYYLKSSSKTGFNLNKVFRLIAELAIANIQAKNLDYSVDV